MESFESKKRKLSYHEHDRCNINVNEEDENEEEKMEQFYTLVKRLREARDRLINGSDALKEMEEKRKKSKLLGEDHKAHDDQVSHAWKPSFQREDFMPEADRDPLKAPQKSEVPQKEEVKGSSAIDLTLSL